MQIEQNRPALEYEVGNTIKWLLSKAWIKKEYSDDCCYWWKALEGITNKQKKYINYLIVSKNQSKLKEVLDSIISRSTQSSVKAK